MCTTGQPRVLFLPGAVQLALRLGLTGARLFPKLRLTEQRAPRVCLCQCLLRPLCECWRASAGHVTSTFLFQPLFYCCEEKTGRGNSFKRVFRCGASHTLRGLSHSPHGGEHSRTHAAGAVVRATAWSTGREGRTLDQGSEDFSNLKAHPQWHTASNKATGAILLILSGSSTP